LTNGFWGLQPALAEHGIVYDAELTQFYQGVANGGLEQTFKYGGKLDQFVIFQGEKLGLWKGFEVIMHAETRFGEDVIAAATDLAPANINMLYPTLNNDTAITGLQFMQALNEDWAITIGRINTLDLFQTLYPQTGRGVDGFMNTSTFLPLTVGTTIPLVFNGAGILKMREGKIQGGVLVLDPRNIPTVSGLEDIFSNGASIVGLWRLFTDVGGKPGSHMFVGSWASGEFTAFDHPWIIEPDVPAIVPPQVSESWSLLYILEQQLWADCSNEKRNVGLLSEWGYSDPGTNPYEWVGNVSLQANGLLPGREMDSMGVGWFYNGLSSDLKNLLSPPLEIRDLTGVEVYYNAAVTPWFHVTADVQVVEPAVRNILSTAFLFGLRAKITL
jgi:porin